MINESGLLELQVKVAFLEDTLSKLSDEHFQQQKDIEWLKRQNEVLSAKLETALDNSANGSDAVADERPPHY